MIIAGFLGMSLKFAECTLAVKYRNENPDGSVSGGPMYYMSKALGAPGRVMAVLFAICCVGGAIGGGNMFQVNQAYQQVAGMLPEGAWLKGNAWAFGLFMAVITGIVIIGGIKTIAKVTDKLTPFMCLLYLAAGLVVLGVNMEAIPAALSTILTTAFNPDPNMVMGGILGALVAGFRRAAFSNEAGFGSAAIAHAAVRTKEPVTEGMVALLEPFIDTIIICTMTALVIVTTGVYLDKSVDGVTLTSHSFATVMPWFPMVLTLVVFLFAYSTMISWSYYGLKAWTYLFGEGRTRELVYKLLFCCFTVVGATMSLGKVIDFSDAMMFAMSITNILALYLLAPTLKREVESYWQRYKAGEFKPKL
jgi:AGCS family alanine or glycine:cation symporter